MNLIQKLKKISKNEQGTLRAAVADSWLDKVSEYDGTPNEQVKAFWGDLSYGGCASGIIGELIYTADAQAFFDEHYDEIENVRFELEEETGEALKIKGDLKNFFAWFGYEHTSYRIAHELGLE